MREWVSTSLPAMWMVPAVTRPLRGRYWTIASAAVDLPQPDSPDEPVGGATLDRQGDAAEDFALPTADAIGNVNVVELERGERRRRLGHRSNTCWSPSAIRFTPTISVAIANAGKSTVHQ